MSCHKRSVGRVCILIVMNIYDGSLARPPPERVFYPIEHGRKDFKVEGIIKIKDTRVVGRIQISCIRLYYSHFGVFDAVRLEQYRSRFILDRALRFGEASTPIIGRMERSRLPKGPDRRRYHINKSSTAAIDFLQRLIDASVSDGPVSSVTLPNLSIGHIRFRGTNDYTRLDAQHIFEP